MVAQLYSMGIYGMDAFPVEVEADLSSGLPAFEVVGLPDAAVKESRDRVRSAMKNCGYKFPVSRITVNLAPADKKKEGTLYDLPLLVALMKASGQLAADLSGSVFLGELSLSGQTRPVRGVLPMVMEARKRGFRSCYVPRENAAEGAVVKGIRVYPVADVPALLAHLAGARPIPPASPGEEPQGAAAPLPDFSEVCGQAQARRALEVAAAGGHNVLLIGSPGSGKSMLARRLPSILPEMTFEETIETTKIHSVAGVLPPGASLIRTRPFRAPHHTVSPAGLAGGGSIPRPGEISLAHNGVLFLDELPEFSRAAMEVLRQPIENGWVTISRVGGTVTYPCSAMFVAAMNPCPCGYFGHPTRHCICTPQAVSRYLARVSGPLLDRLDLHIEVPPVEFEELDSDEKAESSAAIRARVNAARAVQNKRFRGTGIACNARITPDRLREFCPMEEKSHRLLKAAFQKLGLSARAYDRVLKVCRTIADLDGRETILPRHVAEAVQYRTLDRKYWTREL